MLTALCVNAGGLLAVRFFLGVSEAPIAPGLSIVVSMWYKRSEQPLRHAAWFLGNTTAGIFGNLLAYGIGHIEGFPAWKVCIPLYPVYSISLILFIIAGRVLDLRRCHGSMVFRRIFPITRSPFESLVSQLDRSRQGYYTSAREHDRRKERRVQVVPVLRSSS